MHTFFLMCLQTFMRFYVFWRKDKCFVCFGKAVGVSLLYLYDCVDEKERNNIFWISFNKVPSEKQLHVPSCNWVQTFGSTFIHFPSLLHTSMFGSLEMLTAENRSLRMKECRRVDLLVNHWISHMMLNLLQETWLSSGLCWQMRSSHIHDVSVWIRVWHDQIK